MKPVIRVCAVQVGTFLASQADDKSVIIWRVSDWVQVARIGKPFERWITMTFSLRSTSTRICSRTCAVSQP